MCPCDYYFAMRMFYYLLGNLRPCLLSQLRAIQLLAVSRYGVDVILESFVKDLKVLEEVETICTHNYCYMYIVILIIGRCHI